MAAWGVEVRQPLVGLVRDTRAFEVVLHHRVGLLPGALGEEPIVGSESDNPFTQECDQLRLASANRSEDRETRFYVFTEAYRSLTNVLLPEDY